jgi:hypothetical protein
MKINFCRLCILAFCLPWFSALAAPLAVGDAVPVFSAPDQHGKEFIFTNGVQYLLVATEMACGKAANQKLAAQRAGYLETNAAAYLLDIHLMPAVARVFALPKMRKYPQRIVLVESAETLAALPTQPGRVTVLALTSAGRIRKISYWDPVREPVTACWQ